MPSSLLGKALQTVYVTGYFAFIAVAGVATWGAMPFSEWWTYMAFQFVYAIGWPVFVAMMFVS